MHTNRLIHESSPYLLQHAHNPVDWYPWGEEALQKARQEEKPILVSIGYAACHWCHVMERESFENETTAALMNRHFVNIKIDREERPDLDHIYMDAVQAMTGSGGWPLNVFLMPDGKPFYGGTYFPPQRAFNRASWSEVLEGVHQAWTERRHELASQAENLTAHLANANLLGNGKAGGAFTRGDADLIAGNILKQADVRYGGFGAAPKFPQTFSIQYLLRYHHFTGDTESLQQALKSLDAMIDGGIYDQLGGGLARYSTDAAWLAPHFEKMLYDNALLVIVLAEAFQITGNKRYEEVIADIIGFVQREMTHPDGGFFSALDADSEGEEGKFYTWSKTAVTDLLGEDAPMFCDRYDVSEGGNWEHTNILRVLEPIEKFAERYQLPVETVTQRLYASRQRLMEARDQRIRPAMDDKVLLGWNALMNLALSKAYMATGLQSYLELATRNMQFLREELYLNGEWNHTWKEGKAKVPAFLDDLAYLANACIHLQEITGDTAYLEDAASIANLLLEQYSDEAGLLFYFTQAGQQDVVVRKKEIYDGATPSGNAIAAGVLAYLGIALDKMEWSERARQMTISLQSAITRYPTSFGCWAQLALQQVFDIDEIAVVGPGAAGLSQSVLRTYFPQKVLQWATEANDRYPLLRNRLQQKTLIYHCKNYVCNEPCEDLEQLLAKIPHTY